MNQDFSELIKYLDIKFTKIDERFNKIDKGFGLVDQRFDKIEGILVEFNGRFTRIDERLEEKADKSDVNNLTNAVDAYAQKADTYFQEMVMLSHKVDRNEKWIKQLAEKLGVKLEY